MKISKSFVFAAAVAAAALLVTTAAFLAPENHPDSSVQAPISSATATLDPVVVVASK